MIMNIIKEIICNTYIHVPDVEHPMGHIVVEKKKILTAVRISVYLFYPGSVHKPQYERIVSTPDRILRVYE